MNAANIVTLTTDFGLDDAYVGQLKGAVLTANLQVRLVDLCHSIPPQNVVAAAVTLHSSYSFFPQGSVHLVVVDPGVGSQRRLLAAASINHIFVAPDNGIFSLLLRDGILKQIHLVENRKFLSPNISNTFHGRDIMAPVAAALAGGIPLAEVGMSISPASCIRLELPAAEISSTGISGQIIGIDHFGNIRTSITRTDLTGFSSPDRCCVSCCNRQINGIIRTYSDAPPGVLIALFDSSDYLEIAINQGNAAQEIKSVIGNQATVQAKKV